MRLINLSLPVLVLAGLTAVASAVDPAHGPLSAEDLSRVAARNAAEERESKRVPDPAKLKDEEIKEFAACSLAADARPSSRARLIEDLTNAEFLKSLDSESVHASYNQFRTKRILAAVAASNASDAQKAYLYLRLGQSPAYNKHWRRVDWLIEASAQIKQPSRALLDYLDDLAKPGTGNTRLVIKAFLTMGTEESVARVEKRIHAKIDVPNAASDEGAVMAHGERVEYVDEMAYHRNHPAVVAAARRVVASPDLPVAFRNAVVIGLFSDHPYRGMICFAFPPTPPNRSRASAEVLRETLAVGELAEKRGDLSEDAIKCLKYGRPQIQAALAALERHAKYAWDESRKMLENSPDPAALEKTLCELARGGDERSLEFILPFLTDAKFLARLEEVRLPKVLAAVTSSNSQEARQAMVQLGQDPLFAANATRLAALVQACRGFKSDPDDPTINSYDLNELLETLASPDKRETRPPQR